jgi:molecular chaperone GrpE (heat shock protein)
LTEKLDQRLDLWVQTYTVLRERLLDLLKRFDINQMLIQPGEAANYDRIEAFEIVTDLAFKNEQVKEVARRGYEYQEGNAVQVLRPAQVILVKN